VYNLNDLTQKETAQIIKQEIQKIGIQVQIIPVSLAEITQQLRNDSIEYDMMLLGIDIGYKKSGIFPYFHSSQTKNGYNIANI